MSKQADLGAVPHAVVSTILWSNDLHFGDRLRCREVCQAWKSLLRERPGAFVHCDLSTELCINFCCTPKSRYIIGRLNEDTPDIYLIHAESQIDLAAQSTFEDNVSACYRWLKVQARLFRKIELCGYAHTWSLVREMISAIQVAPPQAPPAVAIMMPVGLDLLCNCEDLLVKTLVALHFCTMEPWLHLGKVAQMTHLTSLDLTGNTSDGPPEKPSLNKLTLLQLQTLAELHTLKLYGFREPDLGLQWLHSLRWLCLGACHADFYDLTSCTQLTSLTVTWEPGNFGLREPRRLWLPAGSNVQLQNFSIASVFKGVEYFEELKNLQDATQLMSMDLHNTYPDNLDVSGWPLSMPHLNTISVARMPDWPPQQLANYSQLRHLHIQVEHGAGPMPTWISQLTQLETCFARQSP